MKTKPLNSNDRVGLFYSSLALYGIPSILCQGAVVHDPGGFTVTEAGLMGSEVFWDVDGGGESDFRFYFRSIYRPIAVSSSGLNGQGFVNKTSTFRSNAVQNLSAGFSVKNTLADGYQFGPGSKHQLIGFSYSGNFHYLNDAQGFNSGEAGFAGFKFNISGNAHYGWAKWTFDTDAASLTVSEWAYNDVAGDPIQVGAVPEPRGTAGALGLLALGAAGLHRWRKHRLAKAS